MSKNKLKSNQISHIWIQCMASTQLLNPTKNSECSSESANARKILANRHVHKRAVDYINMEEYEDEMELENRTKGTVNPPFNQPELNPMTTFIPNYNHNFELGQGDTLKNKDLELSLYNVFDKDYSDNAHSNIKLATTVPHHNYYNADEMNYNGHTSKVKLANKNELIDNNKLDYLFYPEVRNLRMLKQQTKIKQKISKYKSENIKKFEYMYDELVSDEENEKNKNKPTDIMDYMQMTDYKTEQTPVKVKCKLKT